jgi:hypothetical protein
MTKSITTKHPTLLIPGRAATLPPAVEQLQGHTQYQDTDELFLYGADYHELPISKAKEAIQQHCDCCLSKSTDHGARESIYLIQSRKYPRFGYAEYY